VVIAGDDFALAAGCTRMSTGYSILSRKQTKLIPLTNKTVLAAVGCMSDVTTLSRMLATNCTEYQHNQNKVMPSKAVAQLLSVTLYYRRFFPYYAFCLLAGLDEEGKGAVYGYDAVGSFKRDDYGAMGTGQNFVMPILDNLVGHKNRNDPKARLTKEEAISICKEVFVVAAERDIHTGDCVEISVITRDGIEKHSFELKKD
jgi:20S proteasome subunit beta 6